MPSVPSVKKAIINLSCAKKAVYFLELANKRDIRLLELAERREVREEAQYQLQLKERDERLREALISYNTKQNKINNII